MNRKIKAIGAALLAAAMCASFAGCADNEKPENRDSKDVEFNESNTENVSDSNSDNQSLSTQPTASKPEDEKITLSEEIVNAKLSSGLIQINNDIFQRGGYITVADFVEKYKDKYTITFYYPEMKTPDDALPYEKCKDYLVEYGGFSNQTSTYTFLLKAKNSDINGDVGAVIVNGFKPGEKITLDKAVIVDVRPIRGNTPEWFPMGINDEFSKVNESKNGSLSPNVLYEAFEAEGIEKTERYPTKDGHITSGYWEEYGRIEWITLGEKNLFGDKPAYFYAVTFAPDTVYLKNELYSLVKE